MLVISALSQDVTALADVPFSCLPQETIVGFLVRGSHDESHRDVATGRGILSRCSLLSGRFPFSVPACLLFH